MEGFRSLRATAPLLWLPCPWLLVLVAAVIRRTGANVLVERKISAAVQQRIGSGICRALGVLQPCRRPQAAPGKEDIIPAKGRWPAVHPRPEPIAGADSR